MFQIAEAIFFFIAEFIETYILVIVGFVVGVLTGKSLKASKKKIQNKQFKEAKTFILILTILVLVTTVIKLYFR